MASCSSSRTFINLVHLAESHDLAAPTTRRHKRALIRQVCPTGPAAVAARDAVVDLLRHPHPSAAVAAGLHGAKSGPCASNSGGLLQHAGCAQTIAGRDREPWEAGQGMHLDVFVTYLVLQALPTIMQSRKNHPPCAAAKTRQRHVDAQRLTHPRCTRLRGPGPSWRQYPRPGTVVVVGECGERECSASASYRHASGAPESQMSAHRPPHLSAEDATPSQVHGPHAVGQRPRGTSLQHALNAALKVSGRKGGERGGRGADGRPGTRCCRGRPCGCRTACSRSACRCELLRTRTVVCGFKSRFCLRQTTASKFGTRPPRACSRENKEKASPFLEGRAGS